MYYWSKTFLDEVSIQKNEVDGKVDVWGDRISSFEKGWGSLIVLK